MLFRHRVWGRKWHALGSNPAGAFSFRNVANGHHLQHIHHVHYRISELSSSLPASRTVATAIRAQLRLAKLFCCSITICPDAPSLRQCNGSPPLNSWPQQASSQPEHLGTTKQCICQHFPSGAGLQRGKRGRLTCQRFWMRLFNGSLIP